MSIKDGAEIGPRRELIFHLGPLPSNRSNRKRIPLCEGDKGTSLVGQIERRRRLVGDTSAPQERPQGDASILDERRIRDTSSKLMSSPSGERCTHGTQKYYNRQAESRSNRHGLLTTVSAARTTIDLLSPTATSSHCHTMDLRSSTLRSSMIDHRPIADDHRSSSLWFRRTADLSSLPLLRQTRHPTPACLTARER